ncbi:MAG: hypothetical protein ABL903_06240 [Methylococcales bacterium]
MKKLNLTPVGELGFIVFFLGVLPIVLLFFLILSATNHHFTYSLDDPYIHLALAKNIALGHYGINSNEVSAPSSSILWPFLLAPFARWRLFEYTPLFINSICLSALLYYLNKLFLEKGFCLRLLLISVVLLSVNAYGLVFTGMEHSLQILLVCIIAVSITALRNEGDTNNRPAVVPNYTYVAIILLTLVRYEGLAIALPVLAYLYFKGDQKRAIISLLVLLVCMLGFSGYLYSLNLGLLPSSVLAKSSHSSFNSILDNLLRNIDKYGFMLLPVSLLCSYYWLKDFALALLIFFATLLHFMLGKFGWFGRFEPYWVLFILLFGYHSLQHKIIASFISVIALLTLPLAFWSLLLCTLNTPLAAANIYNQQAQTAKIAEILAEPVAVNDLGLVALRSNQYVLDLYGLGNLEALKLRQFSQGSGWIDGLMKKHAVKYAFIFDQWFPEKPANWIRVAELKVINRGELIPWDTVAFYAVDEQSKLKLGDAIRKFSSSAHAEFFSITQY